MNVKAIDAIAKAVLYEGYMLYPYRPSSVKNRQRFNFGVLYPRTYSESQVGSDAWSCQTECLVEGSSRTAIEVKIRFLKLVLRATNVKADKANQQSWQEAIECNVPVPITSLGALISSPILFPFSLPAGKQIETYHDRKQVVRSQEFVQGAIKVSVDERGNGVFKVCVVLENLTEFESNGEGRDQALARSLVSAHTLLGVSAGSFVSLLDTPAEFSEIAASCRNIGTWPVLVGEAGKRDTVLSSPIILYDYPQIAPESPGDLFDGAEIDEILSLRILTMTDDEKQEMRESDDHARKMLERTENLPMEHLMKLHGTLRELRPLKEKAS